MDGLVSNAAMILLSLHPSPASETSAFNKIRAFSSRWAGFFPFRIRTSSCSRSSPLNRTTYFFTEISFAAMIRLRRRIVDKANHQMLTNWLKRATSSQRPVLTEDIAGEVQAEHAGGGLREIAGDGFGRRDPQPAHVGHRPLAAV